MGHKMRRPGKATPEDRIATACHSLHMLHRLITGVYDESLHPLGVRASQLQLLVAIATMGEEATTARVGAFLMIRPSTLSRGLQRLRHEGWIERSGEGRARRLTVTKQGRRLLQQALPAWERAQERAEEVLGRELAAAIALRARKVRSRQRQSR